VNSELDKKLVEKYPKIFRDRFSNPKETLMCWGFDVGDGWYKIIDSLCGQIQHHIDWAQEKKEKYGQGEGCSQVVAVQVKEKFGGLRFYYDGGDNMIDGMVRMAESWAVNTCEVCGERGELRNDHTWMYTACDNHERKK
jgi:hypothetical protein